MIDRATTPVVATAHPRQFLTFQLAGEELAIEIRWVQEIRRYSAITSVPNTAPYVRGVMNLRGTIVPVVDLRLRFGLEPLEYTKFTVIITISLGTKLVGMVVDAVSEVITLGADALRPPAELGDAIDTSYLSAMAEVGDRLLTVVDIERVLGVDSIVGGAAST